MFLPGLLPRAHRGVLIVDDLHLTPPHTAHILAAMMSDGEVAVEGVSGAYL